MKLGFFLPTLITFFVAGVACAEEFKPVPESEIMGQASAEDLGWGPRQEAQQSKKRGGEPQIVQDGPFGDPFAPQGRPAIEALKQMRELELEETKVNWSFGVGLQYFVQASAYPSVNLQMALAQNLSAGLHFNTVGEYDLLGTGAQVQLTQGFFTVGLNSERYFRGLQLQAGGGLTIVKTAALSATTPGEVLIVPTAMGTAGWRFRLSDLNGSDDAVSLSVVGGIQAFLIVTNTGDGTFTGLSFAPIARVELNFGF